MEIRDPLHGTIEISSPEVKVIDSLPFQRLRAIKQLGFSEFSFPGATHNRLIHSIGASYLAGEIFDRIFQNYEFKSNSQYQRLKQCTKLAALLHDIGHGPLSHSTEEVMPLLKDLDIKAYQYRRKDIFLSDKALSLDRKANHEDYTIKFITDSSLTEVIEKYFPDISPIHIACLIDKTLLCPDDFFVQDGIDFRGVLSQIISSELDCDRMDYLERDAYFCGTNYGRIELNWLLNNLTYHKSEDDQLYLAIHRRALYAFDDFLLARHHMHLMVYFHHKAIIFEEMLHRYLLSENCEFYLPSEIEKYISCTDYALYEHLSAVDNPWAQSIATRTPYKVCYEIHSTNKDDRAEKWMKELEANGISVIHANSTARVSKYHSSSPEEKSFPIYVVDPYDSSQRAYPIEETTEIFQKYEEIRRIERLYVSPDNFYQAEKIIKR